MKKTFAFLLFFFIIFSVKAQVSIEDLLSVPFPTYLTSSADGKHLAWIFNDKGIHNIFIAEAPDFTTRKLTGHTFDDGLDMNDVVFTPGGNRIVFTDGNNNNSGGEAANPAHLQTETNEKVRMVNTDGSGLRTIGDGHSPSVSPDNKIITYISKGAVWYAPVDSEKVTKKLFIARGNARSIRWSPGGKMLAFISSRGDHALLGIYDFDKNSVTYPDPSVDVDAEPVWSPDGKWIAYARMPSHKNEFSFTEMRESSPWSIRLLNITNGKAVELWKASPGKGSVLFEDLPRTTNLLIWAANDQLVFPWEKDGWLHLYAIPVFKKEAPHLLTPGAGIIENVVETSDKTSLVYTSNIGDSHRRHIWRVNISQGKPVQLSTGNGIEWSPAILQNDIAVLRSTATFPAWPSILQNDGSSNQIAKNFLPVNFPENSLVTPQDVSFKAKDGLEIHGQLFLPPGYDAGKKYPALLFFHGGSRRQMLLGFHYMDYYSNDYAMNQYNAINGYIVLSVNYRSGIGYGLNFREALHYGANGASEYNDVIGAGMYMKNRKDVDPKRIGIWGGSYGGYLTAMGLARNSDVFAAGVDIHGVHDWNEETKNWTPGYDPAQHKDFAKIAFESSPVHFVNGWRSPVLFIHGDDDRNVPFSETVNIIEMLRKRNIYFEQLIFPDEIHSFLLHSNWLQSYHAGEEFFKRMLKDTHQ
ncbi:MAG: prolyl oligopeptidase family serine peptidase [Ginsengibacter sp.]